MAVRANAGPSMVHLQNGAHVSSDPAPNGNGNGSHHQANADATRLTEDELEQLDEELNQEDDTDEDVEDNPWTRDEIRQLRRRLHELGANDFVLEYLSSGRYTARQLHRAFRKGRYEKADHLPDEYFYEHLGRAIVRELLRRQQLEQYKTIDDAVNLLRERKNIMLVTGAGISTSLGIPDFRSKDTGLYDRLRELNDPEITEPEDVFNINVFDRRPAVFYDHAGLVLPDITNWSPTHEFIRLLQDKEKLLTNYTQNIDNIEAHAGISKEKIVQCHGSWATASCRKCKFQVPGEDIFDAVKAQTPAECKQCIKAIAVHKPGTKRKRSSNQGSKKRRRAADEDSDSDGAYTIPTPGIMKPDITFFGEGLPNTFYDRLKNEDREKVDLVIVIGTSLKVAPVSEIPNFVPKDVPHILISRDPISHINFDITLLGDCDVVVAELARRAGWDLRHEMLPAGQKVDVVPIDEEDHTWGLIPKIPPTKVKPKADEVHK